MPVKRVIAQHEPIAASPFGEQAGSDPHNASEVVALGDSRFLFCDNNVSDSLFEMRFDKDGNLEGKLVRHRISGVSPDFFDDFESMAVARAGDRDYLILATSFSLKIKARNARKKRQRGRRAIERESLLRVTTSTSREHEAEIIPGFRSWLIEHVPDLGKRWRKSWRRIPDDGGLNVEGLAWDPVSHELLFGLRTPVVKGRPVILRVRVKDIGGIWNLNNFEMLPPVLLQMDESPEERGIRTMEYDAIHRRVLIVTGNATSGAKVPFELYAWDGNAEGRVRRFDGVHFDPRFRVEGVTPGTIRGREAIIFVDDRGGYQVLWGDDPRMSVTSTAQRSPKSAAASAEPAATTRRPARKPPAP
jgi:hypothetical protein